jgi:hypothetical protein
VRPNNLWIAALPDPQHVRIEKQSFSGRPDMKKGLKRSTCFLLIPLLIGVQSCVVATKSTVITPQIQGMFKGTYKVDPYMEKHMPRTIAVLPFLNQAESKKGSDEVRKGFYNHFSSLPFKDMELYRVDNLLRKADLTDPAIIFKKSPKDLGNILGVDAVVYGEVSNFDKLFAVVYYQVYVGAASTRCEFTKGVFPLLPLGLLQQLLPRP